MTQRIAEDSKCNQNYDKIITDIKDQINREEEEVSNDTREQVRHLLLNYNHIRNSLFDAKEFMVWRMINGRKYFCSERCDSNNLEAHWHLRSGKGLMYSFVAHVSSDGTQYLHSGAEHGYQYNSIPGSAHFGKIIHFSEKLIDAKGKLVYVKNDNVVVESCVYCDRQLMELMF